MDCQRAAGGDVFWGLTTMSTKPEQLLVLRKWLYWVCFALIVYCLVAPLLIRFSSEWEPPNPRNWDSWMERSYERERARIFRLVAKGYLLAVVGLFASATLSLFWLKDQKAFWTRILFTVIAGIGLFIFHAMGTLPKIK